jgi:hypothetical protein
MHFLDAFKSKIAINIAILAGTLAFIALLAYSIYLGGLRQIFDYYDKPTPEQREWERKNLRHKRR